jgi:heme A synthase
MTEYQVKPKDVFVLRQGGRRGPPRPPEPGIAGWLKRNRFKLALGLIVAELLVAWKFDISAVPLLIVAVLVLGLFLIYRTRLTNPAVRNAAWVLVFSQAAVAIVPLFVAVTLFAIVIVAAVVVVIMVMLLLGERSRR